MSDANATTASKARYYTIEVQQGRRYLLCQCGLSHKKPFCDGSHAGSGKLPYFYTPTETGPVNVCCCDETSTMRLCDGRGACCSGA